MRKFLVLSTLLFAISVCPVTAASLTIPAGTHLMVKLDSAINSNQHKAGHKFTGKLEGALFIDGKEIAPRGAQVYGELNAAKKSGRLAGKSEMEISLTHILIDNQLRPIMTSDVGLVSEGTGKRTVGTTARGAAIGGMINGGKGAETGAAVGLGVSMLTRGSSINVPAGTLLDFTLAAPLTI